jgi:geranylgeranyl pyrophosphate synthase
MNEDSQIRLQLGDGGRVETDGSRARWSAATGQVSTGVVRRLGSWTSLRTLARYPTSWAVDLPGRSIVVHARGDAQEDPAAPSWRGQVVALDADGPCGDGEAWSRVPKPDIADMLRCAAYETRRAVAALLPLDGDRAAMERTLATPTRGHWLDGADLEGCREGVLGPLRYTVDLGGKAWRSLILVGAADLVGGDPERCRAWMAVPEIVHSGSLMVDDVQDGSPLRRGAAACHLVHGLPNAINAGTFGYLVADVLIRESGRDGDTRAWLYEELLGALRAAHAGQALDLRGLDVDLPVAELRGRLSAIHRLKSGVPTAAGARLGAILGGGSTEQVELIGRYAEALGLAYQIQDDVLDVRGHGGRKRRGEDLARGKVTYPLVASLERLSPRDAERLRRAARSPEEAADELPALLDLIASSGALERCEAEADERVSAAWERVDRAFPPSAAKAMVRALSTALLGR